MTTSISSQLENQRTLALASYRCEYCHRVLMNELYEIEHINPQAHGGETVPDNLAIACSRCNRNKGTRSHFVDPFTRSLSPIFNPRTMKWPDHFDLIGAEVVGRIPVGRATAALLFRSTPNFAPPDLQWDKLEAIERNEYLYRFLNHLRYRRIQNQFAILQRSLDSSLPPFDINPEELKIVNRVKNFLQLELFFTRSRSIDVERGIQLGETLLSSAEPVLQVEVKQILSILYQQRATMKFAAGHISVARSDQGRSYELFGAIDRDLIGTRHSFEVPDDLKQFLRAITIHHKYDEIQVGTVHLSELVSIAVDLRDENDFSHLTYLADLILLAEDAPTAALEAVYEVLTDLLETSGYGTISDIAKHITVRRRWWTLQFILEKEVWYDALISDLLYWRKINMFNEIRELITALDRVKYKINQSKYIEIRNLIQGYGQEKISANNIQVANKANSADEKNRKFLDDLSYIDISNTIYCKDRSVTKVPKGK
jgi:hypothetical protein